MLTIVNIDKIKVSNLKVAGEKWELKHIIQAQDIYQFVYSCYELNPTTIGTKVLGRKAVVNLGRESVDASYKNVYELKCVTNGNSRLVDLEHLKAPGKLISPMLRVIDGC